jgi:hypothetical protein
MANPTTNFGWQMPTSTDLVTDLPADFEVFGQAVDTALAELKGGTTGQVLSKTSGTDMDFTWVTTDDANAIQNAIVDAKGDLIAASAADTPARLAVGNNGETLVADSSTSTGLRYQSAFNGNAVINGGFDVWQRGTSFTAATVYTADRWQKGGGANYTVTRQTSGLTGFTYCLRAQRNSGATTTNTTDIAQAMETETSLKFAGKAVALSFWARAGANYSSASSALSVRLIGGTGTDQTVFAGYTGSADQISTSVTLTTSWQRFSVTGTVSSNITELSPYFSFAPVGTAGAADYFEIAGVQLELGSIATSFTRAGGTVQGELAACQRYYWRNSVASDYGTYSLCYATSTTQAYAVVNFPTAMRVIPTSVDFSSLAVDFSGVSASAVSAITGGQGTNLTSGLTLTTTGLTQYRVYDLCNNNSTLAYLGFSAEL